LSTITKHSAMPVKPSGIPVLAVLGLIAATQTRAAVIVTLPTPSLAGSLVITSDINFAITDDGDVRGIVFDEWVTSDGAQQFINGANISPGSLTYSINSGSPAAASLTGLFDNFAFNAA
jgi:hypothetical protein